MPRTAEGVLDFFRNNDGLGETPPGSNCNWLTDWYGMGCVPWCAITVSRAMAEAGFGDPEDVQVQGVERTTRKGWAYVPYMKKAFVDAGWYYGPDDGQPGDWVIFDWDGDGWGDHVGVVETRLDGGETYLCREGNNSWNNIALRRRPKSLIDGFCRPPYDGLGGPPIPEPPTHEHPPWPGRYLRYPPVTIGGDVRLWQARMAERGWRIYADGAFGPASRRVASLFQEDKGLEVDGIVGRETWDAAWNLPIS